MGYSLYRHRNEAIGFLLEGSSFSNPKDDHKENQPISLGLSKKKPKNDEKKPKYEYVVKTKEVVEENVPSLSHIDIVGLGSLQVTRPIYGSVKKGWPNALKNKVDMKAPSSATTPLSITANPKPAVVMMPRQVIREKSGKTRKEEIKLESLLELRPATRAQGEIEDEGDENELITVKDELSRELWFPKKSGETPESFKDPVERTLEDGVNDYIGKRKMKKALQDDGLQLHMASLEAVSVRKLLETPYENPPNTVRSRHVKTPTNVRVSKSAEGFVPETSLKFPYISNKSGPVNVVLQHQGISASESVKVLETKDVPVKKSLDLRNQYAKNLERNWLRNYRAEQKKKRKERRVVKWVTERVDLRNEDFSKAFYSSDEEDEAKEDEKVFDVTLRDIMSAMSVSEDQASRPKSVKFAGIPNESQTFTERKAEMHDNVVKEDKTTPERSVKSSSDADQLPEHDNGITNEIHTSFKTVSSTESIKRESGPIIQIPTVQHEDSEEAENNQELEGMNDVDNNPGTISPESNNTTDTASTDVVFSEATDYDHETDVKLLRYASMDVLFTDMSDESGEDIEIKLDEVQAPYDLYVKHKVRKKYLRSHSRYQDLLYDSDDDHGMDKVEEEVNKLSDKEIRAMRLNLLEESKNNYNIDFNNMSEFAAGIMSDLNKLNKPKKKKKKRRASTNETVLNLKEKFLAEYGHLLNMRQREGDDDADQLELPRENTAKFLESVSDDIELVRTMSAMSDITRRSSVFSGNMRKKWKRLHNMKSPYKKAKKELMVFPNRSRQGQRSQLGSESGSTIGSTINGRRLSMMSNNTNDDLEEDVEDVELQDIDEVEEMEFIKAMAWRRLSYQGPEKPDFIEYDKHEIKMKTEEEKAAEKEAIIAERKAERKLNKKNSKSSSKSGSAKSFKSQISNISDSSSKGSRRGSISRRRSSSIVDELWLDDDDLLIKDFVIETQDVAIDTSLPPRPDSACRMPAACPELNLNDLLEGIDIPAKDVKIAIVYRRRRRQRQRAAQRLAEKEVMRELPVEKKEEPSPRMELTKDAPFIKACLSWNQNKGIRHGFSEEELDWEVAQLLKSGLFRDMRSCRWIRWNKRQQAAIERLWELELVGDGLTTATSL